VNVGRYTEREQITVFCSFCPHNGLDKYLSPEVIEWSSKHGSGMPMFTYTPHCRSDSGRPVDCRATAIPQIGTAAFSDAAAAELSP